MRYKKFYFVFIFSSILSLTLHLHAKAPFSSIMSMVRGTTEKEATLTFLCDDGGRYRTQSRSYGIGRPHFSLTLPRDQICRLLIMPRGSAFPTMVTFRDHRDNQSPLLYLKSSRIDLGFIRDFTQRPYTTLNHDDALLASVNSDATRQAPELCLKKTTSPHDTARRELRSKPFREPRYSSPL